MKKIFNLYSLSLILFILTINKSYSQGGTNDLTFNPIDTGYGTGEGPNGAVHAIAIDSNENILIGGIFSSYNGTNRNSIARLSPNGNLDKSFDPGTGANARVNIIAIQIDGKILIGGRFNNFNGSAVNRLVRLESDGSIDISFNTGTGANNEINAIAIQDDGKILVGGDFTDFNGTATNRIVRLNADGSLDEQFNSGTGTNNYISHIVIQNDNKIIIGGDFTIYNNTNRNRVARLNQNGSIDTSFDPGMGANDAVNTIAFENNGQILIGGKFTQYNGIGKIGAASIKTDGSLDQTFDLGTLPISDVVDIAINSEGENSNGWKYNA